MAVDSAGHPAVGLSITLLDGNGSAVQSVATGEAGTFRFTEIAPGLYRLATKEGRAFATRASLAVTAGATVTVRLALSDRESPSSGDPAFFDQPTFAVAGVTDTTNLAVHGSDKVARGKDELAKSVVDLAGLPSHAQQTTPASKDTQEIREMIAGGDYAHAQVKLHALLQMQDRPELHELLGNIEEKLGDPLSAVREYQRAAEMDPSETYLMLWGSEFLLHHAPHAAVQIFDEGTRRFPSSARLLSARGVAHYVEGSYEQAAIDLCRASDMDPGDTNSYVFLGRIVEIESTMTDAVFARLARFARDHPESAQAAYFYALALKKKNEGDTAKVDNLLRRATELDPAFARAYLQLGILYQETDPARAQLAFERAISIDPEMPEPHFRMAELYRKLGDDSRRREQLDLFQRLTKNQSRETERERHDIQQFVIATRP